MHGRLMVAVSWRQQHSAWMPDEKLMMVTIRKKFFKAINNYNGAISARRQH
jgi:hypothetical protein